MKTLAVLLTLSLSLALTAAEDEQLDQAVAKGLEALVRMQGEDGSFGNGAGITALGGMALLSGGHTPTRGAYQEASAKALTYVIKEQDPLTGYLGSGMGNMYSHGFATLYLAECYGMSPDPRIRRALEAALDLIFRAQNRDGGWRYQPVPVDADISVTICQIMAIRAAYNIGIGGDRAQDVIGKAIAYVRNCANPNGTFVYKIGSGGWGTKGADAVPRCAAGAMSLIGSGINDLSDPVLGPAMRFLRNHVGPHLKGGGNWFWYGQYYAAQAMFHSPDLNDWQRYWEVARPTLLGYQDDDGVWNRPDDHGAVFGTAMALIIMQIPNNYLPIFQR